MHRPDLHLRNGLQLKGYWSPDLGLKTSPRLRAHPEPRAVRPLSASTAHRPRVATEACAFCASGAPQA
eukprot:1703243-Pyramimonas_sp.AAC.1